MTIRTRVIVAAATAVVLAGGAFGGWALMTAGPRATVAAAVEAQAHPVEYNGLTQTQIDALPAAQYDAVIAGLIPYTDATVPSKSGTAYSVRADTPIYAADQTTAVARLTASNFLGNPTVVMPMQFSPDGAWALVLTPARQALPSARGGNAPAQSAGWVRTDALTKVADLSQHIVVSVSAQTLSIVSDDGTAAATFAVGVGTGNTPTPTGVTGYLQARYLDPAQDETVHPIQLTSLHSAADDEPLDGGTGGLIGVHYQTDNTGAVSHGCIRLPDDAIDAVNQLPLGTLISITA